MRKGNCATAKEEFIKKDRVVYDRFRCEIVLISSIYPVDFVEKSEILVFIKVHKQSMGLLIKVTFFLFFFLTGFILILEVGVERGRSIFVGFSLGLFLYKFYSFSLSKKA